jgi:thioredoxin-related protein
MKTFLISVLLIFIMIEARVAVAQERFWNNSSPGQRFEITDNLDRERVTIVVFHSDRSSACLNFKKKLAELVSQDASFKVGYLDIDRDDAKDIDWNSPLSRQYNLRSVPYVVVYQGKTKLNEGHKAREFLLKRWDEKNP